MSKIVVVWFVTVHSRSKRLLFLPRMYSATVLQWYTTIAYSTTCHGLHTLDAGRDTMVPDGETGERPLPV